MPIARTLLLSSDPLHVRDAKAYRSLLSRNGVTLSSAAFYELVTFAKELYRLVGRQDFISLRSAHNMGTGGTAYTFHGRTATLVNGPTWGVDGVTFARASDHRLTATLAANKSYHGVVAVCTRGDTSNSGLFGDILNGGNTSRRVELGISSSGNVQYGNHNGTTFSSAQLAAAAVGTPMFLSAIQTASNLSARRDGNTTTATLQTPGGFVNPILAGAGAWKYEGVASFVALISSDSPLPDCADEIRTAYKATLGLGISLP